MIVVKGVITDSNIHFSDTKKDKGISMLLTLYELQQQMEDALNPLFVTMAELRDDIQAIDIRLAEINRDLDLILQLKNLDDMLDASGNIKPDIARILNERGKDNLSTDEAFDYLTTIAAQDLLDEQQDKTRRREDALDEFDAARKEAKETLKSYEDQGVDTSEVSRRINQAVDDVAMSKGNAANTLKNLDSATNIKQQQAGNLDFIAQAASPS